jgi:hypothetical protein
MACEKPITQLGGGERRAQLSDEPNSTIVRHTGTLRNFIEGVNCERGERHTTADLCSWVAEQWRDYFRRAVKFDLDQPEL